MQETERDVMKELTTESVRNGEENLHESSEKKKVKADVVPKSTTLKTGTHLGNQSQNKNIFLNKFISNSTKNSNEIQEPKLQKFDFAVKNRDQTNETPKQL